MSSKSRTPLVLGLAAAGGVGYYLYNAGGSPRAAEKKFESDAHKAAASVKSHLPGQSPGAEKYGERAGAKVDAAVADADSRLGAAKSNAEGYAKEAKANTMQAIDKADRKIEEGAAKAKGWFSSGK